MIGDAELLGDVAELPERHAPSKLARPYGLVNTVCNSSAETNKGFAHPCEYTCGTEAALARHLERHGASEHMYLSQY